MFDSVMRKFVKAIDPKLDRYRMSKSIKPVKYTPKSTADFIDVLRRTPRSILNNRDRGRIAAIMGFDERMVGDLMVPKSKMVFVTSKEILGPLVLDKLYKSGFTNFPVVGSHDNILGIIHTEALNALEIKDTDKATKYIDRNVHYLHASDSLAFAVDEIERTNSYYFLVLDADNNMVGFFTIQLLLDYLLG
ncbi:MAG: CBS domain-containing protein [Candidatus Saccharimonadaceae bacterium]|nr:CBS domain-containing protein [Candidatus Saccharimonadaceae bacterium]